MTDEEIKQKADRQYFTHYEEDYHYFDRSDLELYEDGYKDGYEQGYEQGYEDCRRYAHDYYKPKRHDLRKDPNDLPKEYKEYWCEWEDGTYSIEHYFRDCGFISGIIAWCELPKFEE